MTLEDGVGEYSVYVRGYGGHRTALNQEQEEGGVTFRGGEWPGYSNTRLLSICLTLCNPASQDPGALCDKSQV